MVASSCNICFELGKNSIKEHRHIPPVLRFLGPVKAIELVDIECVLGDVSGVQIIALINPPFWILRILFLQQKILGRVNFALINPPFCGDTFLTDGI